MKKFLNYLLLFTLLIAISELLFGYAIFQKLNKDKQDGIYSSIYKVTRYLYNGFKANVPYIDMLDNSNGVYPVDLKKRLSNSDFDADANVFTTKNPYKKGFYFHPFLDFTGAQSGEYNFDVDFFGYRNRFDYSTENKEDEFRILMTGGSECVGHTHNQPIAFLLEKSLRKHYSSKKIRILNFCLNAYTLAYEIQTFVHLGWGLEPHLVISHTGWNDAYAFPVMPKKFGERGLNYAIFQEEWMDILYSIDTIDLRNLNNKDSIIRNHDQEMFIDSIKKTLKKYKALVNASGSDFLVGIQPWNIYPHSQPLLPGKHRDMVYANVEMLKNQADSFQMNVINFSKNNERYRFDDDAVHTTQESARLVANEYFLYIIENYNDKIASIINLDN